MKLLLVLVSAIALCTGNAIPPIPGDNSHYVPGESRYIWMSDDEGVPVLVDLHKPVDYDILNSRSGADNQYWLYTRSNLNNPQIIVHGNVNTIRSSNYVASRPLMVIVHGWNSNGYSDINSLMRLAFLNTADVNVIVVDWSRLANNIDYVTSVNGLPNVGQFLGLFLVWLINTVGGNWNDVHLIGHSLGAHVVGYAGRTTGSRPGRITGLDPAAPLFDNNENAVNANDGQYVEAIHTDGGVFGIYNPIGHANFYPNGGRSPQPGCSTNTCSHIRAYELMASSIRTNHFVGRLCDNFEQAQDNQCSGNVLHNMGNGIVGKRGSGLYSLTTGSSWPF